MSISTRTLKPFEDESITSFLEGRDIANLSATHHFWNRATKQNCQLLCKLRFQLTPNLEHARDVYSALEALQKKFSGYEPKAIKKHREVLKQKLTNPKVYGLKSERELSGTHFYWLAYLYASINILDTQPDDFKQFLTGCKKAILVNVKK